MARAVAFSCLALFGIAASAAVATHLSPGNSDQITVAAVQLTPEGGWSPLTAGIGSGMQVSRVLSDLVAGGSQVTRRTAAGVSATAVPDLVVFPEYMLLGNYSTDMCSQGDAALDTFSQLCHSLPSNGVVDCGNIVEPTPLFIVACSVNASLYVNTTVSLNICERCEGSTASGGPCAVTKHQSPAPASKDASNTAFFNTQVILRGTQVVSAYRKVHPWATACYDTPALDVKTFTVANPQRTASKEFGLFTCFDIMFEQPAADLLAEGVKAFSYSSAIPLIGRATVDLFAQSHNVTVVNSNLQTGQTAVHTAGTVLAACDSGDKLCAAIASL